MNNVWSTSFYDKWVEAASPEIQDLFKKEIDYLKNSIKPNSRVLDVGCGFGRHIKILAGFSKEIIGVDNNENMIQKAKQNLPDFKNVKLFLQNAKKINFDNDSFDYVICMTNTFGDFFEGDSFKDIRLDVLKEMKRVCKEGGKIILSVFSEKSLETRKKSYEKANLSITKIEKGIVYGGKVAFSQFEKPQLEELFNKIDLKVKITELTPISYLCESVKSST